NSFSSSSQNPSIAGATVAASGTYSVNVTVAGCTSSNATTSVTVNPIPVTPTASSNSPICAGSTLNLFANTIAGATYSWTGPNGFSSSSQNPSIAGATVAASGTYSVNVTVSGCTGSDGTVVVTVNTIPAPPTVSSNTPVCTGTPLNLFASTIAGATYSWTGPNGFSSALQNPTIASATLPAAGTYSVTVTVGGCASSSPATTTVVVNATPNPPTITSNSPLCVGATLNINSSFVAGATYSWTGPAGFSSSTQTNSIPNVTSANAGIYSVNVTVNGCTSANATFNVVIHPIPNPPTASSNSPVCTGNTLNLFSSFVAGATYNWTGPNSYSGTGQNRNITNITLAGAGTYSVTVTVLGCTSTSAGTTTVVVNPTPAPPTVSSNSPICEGSTLNLTASNVAGGTYSWTGPNGFTSTTQNPSIPAAILADTGTYSVTVTVGGCPSVAASVNVIINPIPSAPSPSSNSPICAGSTLNLFATNVAGATYSWNGPNGFSSSSQNPSIVSATTAATGTYTVNVTVNGCTSVDSTTFAAVSATPTTPVVSSNSPVCAGTTLQLLVDTIPGATYSWSGPNGFSSTLQDPTIPNITAAGAGTYTVTANNGCASVPGTTTVVVNATPNPPVASNNGPLCSGSNLNLNSSNVAGATYSWSGPNSFSASTQNTSIPGATSADAGTYSVTVTVNGCTSNAATTNVVINTPAVVNAGPDVTVCDNNPAVLLSGTSSTGSGIWSTSGTGIFSPGNTALNGTYNPSSADTTAGSVTLTLTSTANGACPSANDQLVITITDGPVANAGADQTVCANNAAVSLGGSIITATGGQWSSSGTGTFTPSSTTLNATYNPSAADTAAGTVTLYLSTTGNGQCFAAIDSMIITITNAPLVNAGSNIFVCANNPNAALSGTSSTGSGTWNTNGTGTFTPNATTLNATYVPTNADTAAGSVLVWLTSTGNGNCLAVQDTITITYTQPPTVYAGEDQTVCANNDSVYLAGTSSTGSGIWTTSGTGTFVPNATTNNATYVPSAADTASGFVTLTFTTTNNGGCLAVSDQVAITITPAPIVNAGPDQSICGNNAVAVLNGSFSVSMGGVWSTTGSGTFTPANTDMNASYVASSADTTLGFVDIILTTTGNGVCNPVSDTMVLSISNAPHAIAGPDIISCINSPNTPLNGTTSTGSGTWSTAGTGTFTPNASTLNATYIPSAADTTAGSVTLYLSTTNNGTCNPVTDTLIITFAPVPTVTTSPDQTVCANNDLVSVTGSSSTGSGFWTTSGSGTFAPTALVTNPVYTPSASDTTNGSVLLTYHASNACTPVTSTITITITPAPYVLAGADQSVCANNANVILSGYVGGGTNTGDWSTSGSGTFSPSSSSLNATYSPSAADTIAGSVFLILTSTGNGICNAVSDTVVLTITHQPDANAGPDMSACANNATALNGTISGGSGTGIWTTPNGNGTFSNATSLTSTYTPSNSDTLASPIMLILTSTGNGGCTADADTMFITVTPGPVVFAGVDQTVCANNPDVNLNGSVTIASGGIWNTTGNGVFIPGNTVMNPTYLPDTSDVNNGSVVVYLTSTGNGLCSPVVDSMTIFFSPSPLVNAGGNQNICAGNTAVTLNGTISGGATTGIWTTLGSGTFTPNDSTLNATYNLSAADTSAGTVTLILTSTNNGTCNPDADTMQIIITPIATAFAGNDSTICANTGGYVLNGNVIGNSGTGYWTTSGSGTFTPDSSALNATYVPSGTDTSSGSVTLVLVATNTCIPSSDSIVLSFIPASIAQAGPDVVICGGGNVLLNGNISGATGGQWSTSGDGTFSPSSSVLNPVYTPGTNDTASGNVTLYFSTTGSGICSGVTDSMQITIGHKPDAQFSSGVLCNGVAGSFTDLSTVVNDSIVNWSWTSGTDTSSSQNPNFVYTTNGNQSVTLIVISSAGCSDTITKTVNVNPSPAADFSSALTCPFNAAFTDSSTISSGTIITWNWSFGDSTFSSLQDPTHTYNDTTWYHVTLVVTSDSGCVSSYSDSILFVPCEEHVTPPGVPTAFTPNGDNVNDILFVKGGPFTQFEFRVFNEWGNQVFESNSQTNGWNGTYRSKPQPAGTYVWTLVGVTADNKYVNMSGGVNLIR
ncbi:MAG: gliding motility-associated C-terminal domain-containing protein, partial [Bacteroidetes bacterium]|nr:gliding motility-associated C-terminal domain-containing protein [Bacteroidota bacterium]